MNPKDLKKVIKKADDLVEVLDNQMQATSDLIDSLKNYQEFLESEAERLKAL